MTRGGKAPGLVLAGEPRVQLLPPAIQARAKAREAVRLGVLLVILAVVIVGGGIVYGYSSSAIAQSALERARNESTEILGQQAQYVEGSRLAAAVAETEEAIVVGGATHVLWSELYDDISSALPASVVIDEIAFTGRAPWDPALVPEGPLRAAREVSVLVTVLSPEIPDATAFFRDLEEAIPSFRDATIYSSTSQTSADAYRTEVSLALDSSVLSGVYGEEAVSALADLGLLLAEAVGGEE